MGEVNDAYLLILKRFHVEVDETTNYRNHLKQPITKHLPNAQFVKSFRKNEPDNIVLPKTVNKAMEIRSTLLNNGEIIGQLKNMADIPHHLLFGRHVMTISGIRNEELDKT